MVCLGIEPGAAGWKARTNPLSYGGTPHVFYECSQEVYWLSLFAQDGQEEVQRKVDDDAKYSGNDAQHLHLVGQVLEDAQQADGRPLVFGGILSDAGVMHFPWVAWAFSRRRWTAGSVQ